MQATLQQADGPVVLLPAAPGTILRAAQPVHRIVLCASPLGRCHSFNGKIIFSCKQQHPSPIAIQENKPDSPSRSDAREVRSLCRLRCSRQLTPSCFGTKHRGRSCVPRSRYTGLSSVRLCSANVAASTEKSFSHANNSILYPQRFKKSRIFQAQQRTRGQKPVQASLQQAADPVMLQNKAPGTILRAAQPAHGIVICAFPLVG